jgi:hypothetical protein
VGELGLTRVTWQARGAGQDAGQAGEQVGASRGVWGMLQVVAEGGGAGGVRLLSRRCILMNTSVCHHVVPFAALRTFSVHCLQPA